MLKVSGVQQILLLLQMLSTMVSRQTSSGMRMDTSALRPISIWQRSGNSVRYPLSAASLTARGMKSGIGRPREVSSIISLRGVSYVILQ